MLLGLHATLVACAEDETPVPDPYNKPPEEEPEDDVEERKKKAEGLSFCEYDNCYELLGVRPESGPIPIKRAYRKLAAEWHPDKCPSGNIEKCKAEFPKYANAYEILSSSDTRKSYDYVLKHPYEFPGFYMKYSRPHYAPKSDLRFVVLVTVICASVMQHFLKKSQYDQGLSALKKHPGTRYNERLNEMIASSGSPKKAKSSSTKAKAGTALKGEELDKRRKECEAILHEELSLELPPAPRLADTLGVELFKLPLTTITTVQWYLSGGSREPGYMTRKVLGISASEWALYSEEEVEELVAKELWDAEKLAAYQAEVAEMERTPLKFKSSKEKRAARQRKHNPTNQAEILRDA